MKEYIEREAFIQWLDVNHLRNASEPCLSELNVLDMIKMQPAADVAPVAHDEWHTLICTAYMGNDEFGEPIYADRRFHVHRKCGRKSAIKEKYCPECGAKMDGAADQ